jgi:hypothetical protein
MNPYRPFNWSNLEPEISFNCSSGFHDKCDRDCTMIIEPWQIHGGKPPDFDAVLQIEYECTCECHKFR